MAAFKQQILADPTSDELAAVIRHGLSVGASVECRMNPGDVDNVIVITWFGDHCRLSDNTEIP